MCFLKPIKQFLYPIHELQILRFSLHLQEYNDGVTQKLNDMRKVSIYKTQQFWSNYINMYPFELFLRNPQNYIYALKWRKFVFTCKIISARIWMYLLPMTSVFFFYCLRDWRVIWFMFPTWMQLHSWPDKDYVFLDNWKIYNFAKDANLKLFSTITSFTCFQFDSKNIYKSNVIENFQLQYMTILRQNVVNYYFK